MRPPLSRGSESVASGTASAAFGIGAEAIGGCAPPLVACAGLGVQRHCLRQLRQCLRFQQWQWVAMRKPPVPAARPPARGGLATGTNSVAVGGSLFGVLATEASGNYSTAVGGGAWSGGINSTALGNAAESRASNSVALSAGRSPTATTPCRWAVVAIPARSPTWLLARRALMRSTRTSSTP